MLDLRSLFRSPTSLPKPFGSFCYGIVPHVWRTFLQLCFCGNVPRFFPASSGCVRRLGLQIVPLKLIFLNSTKMSRMSFAVFSATERPAFLIGYLFRGLAEFLEQSTPQTLLQSGCSFGQIRFILACRFQLRARRFKLRANACLVVDGSAILQIGSCSSHAHCSSITASILYIVMSCLDAGVILILSIWKQQLGMVPCIHTKRTDSGRKWPFRLCRVHLEGPS